MVKEWNFIITKITGKTIKLKRISTLILILDAIITHFVLVKRIYLMLLDLTMR